MSLSIYTSHYMPTTPSEATRVSVTTDEHGHPTVWLGGSAAGFYLGLELRTAMDLADAIVALVTAHEDAQEQRLTIVRTD